MQNHLLEGNESLAYVDFLETKFASNAMVLILLRIFSGFNSQYYVL